MTFERIKINAIKGIRVSLIAFIICFVVAFLVSLVINMGYLDEINVLLNGTLSDEPQKHFSNVLIFTTLIINLSVFNSGSILENGGSLHIGLLIFITLPAIAFFIADRRNNREKHFDSQDFSVYIVSSFLFSVYLYVYSVITQGDLLGISINYTDPKNFFMTIIILLTLQFFIGFNYKKSMPIGIQTSRWLFRLFLALTFMLSAGGILYITVQQSLNMFLAIIVIIVLVPNLAIYLMFMFMGASIEFGDQLKSLMAFANIDLSFATFSLPIRIGFIVCFFIIILIAIWKLGREKFLEELFLFATSFSVISLILAYCTTMNLGFVKSMVDVQFGINYVFAFMVPFVVVLLAGLILHIFRLIVFELKN
jgi:hypothetical protein